MTEEKLELYRKLEKQLAHIVNEVATIHTKDESIRFEFSAGSVLIFFK